MSNSLGESTFPNFWGHFPRPWPQSFSSCRIFLDLSLSESQTSTSQLELVQFSAKSTEDRLRYLNFCEIIFAKSVDLLQHDLPQLCAIKYCSSSTESVSVSTSHFPIFDVTQPDLAAARSRAVEFSWTSRFQNLKPRPLSLSWYNSQQNQTIIGRDILIFVKYFSQKALTLFSTICPSFVL